MLADPCAIYGFQPGRCAFFLDGIPSGAAALPKPDLPRPLPSTARLRDADYLLPPAPRRTTRTTCSAATQTPEYHRAQSCAIALRSPAPERSSDRERYSQLFTTGGCAPAQPSCQHPTPCGNSPSPRISLHSTTHDLAPAYTHHIRQPTYWHTYAREKHCSIGRARLTPQHCWKQRGGAVEGDGSGQSTILHGSCPLRVSA